jgi:hypothetical protein
VQVGSVIRNPEVSVLVPVLLGAIADTAKQTRPTLEVLVFIAHHPYMPFQHTIFYTELYLL